MIFEKFAEYNKKYSSPSEMQSIIERYAFSFRNGTGKNIKNILGYCNFYADALDIKPSDLQIVLHNVTIQYYFRDILLCDVFTASNFYTICIFRHYFWEDRQCEAISLSIGNEIASINNMSSVDFIRIRNDLLADGIDLVKA